MTQLAATYTSDYLIASMRTLGFIPAGTGLTTAQILKLFTDEMGLYIPALLRSIREEFIISTVDLTVTEATVDVPARACGAALRTIAWVGLDGSEEQLDRIEPERRGDYSLTSDRPAGYIFQGNSVILVPAVSSGTLRVAYQQRPGVLVLPESCAQVTSVDDAVTVTAYSVPDDLVSGSVCDIVSSVPNFKLLAMDVEVDSVSGNVIEFVDALPSGLNEFDFICLAGQTPIPQMPVELHTVLAQRVAYKLNEAPGNARLPAIAAGLKQAREDVITLLSPRSDGSSRPIVSRHGAGAFRWW